VGGEGSGLLGADWLWWQGGVGGSHGTIAGQVGYGNGSDLQGGSNICS
jgi:hypothetical protein